jgi:hypothetical protein
VSASGGLRVDRDRTQRLMNGVALLLVAAGVATYGYALRRMELIRGGETLAPASSVVGRNLDQFWAIKDLSDVGLGMALAGVALAVAAAVRHARRTRRLANGQENGT